MSSLRLFAIVVLVATTGTAAADPPAPATANPPAPATANPPAPTAPFLVLQPLALFDVPAPPAEPSLRIEAARVAAERFAESWRYPEPGPLLGVDHGDWFIGYGHYRPRTARSAALHTGSVAATLLGEILLAVDSPLAGVAALATGATLDAAAADVDRDAEARR